MANPQENTGFLKNPIITLNINKKENNNNRMIDSIGMKDNSKEYISPGPRKKIQPEQELQEDTITKMNALVEDLQTFFTEKINKKKNIYIKLIIKIVNMMEFIQQLYINQKLNTLNTKVPKTLYDIIDFDTKIKDIKQFEKIDTKQMNKDNSVSVSLFLNKYFDKIFDTKNFKEFKTLLDKDTNIQILKNIMLINHDTNKIRKKLNNMLRYLLPETKVNKTKKGGNKPSKNTTRRSRNIKNTKKEQYTE
jgi:hypothetical protein